VIVLTFNLFFVLVNSIVAIWLTWNHCLEQFKCVANLPSPPEVPNHYYLIYCWTTWWMKFIADKYKGFFEVGWFEGNLFFCHAC
jgi:hypothetical protein